MFRIEDLIITLNKNIEITEKEIEQNKMEFVFHYLNGKKEALESVLEYINERT